MPTRAVGWALVVAAALLLGVLALERIAGREPVHSRSDEIALPVEEARALTADVPGGERTEVDVAEPTAAEASAVEPVLAPAPDASAKPVRDRLLIADPALRASLRAVVFTLLEPSGAPVAAYRPQFEAIDGGFTFVRPTLVSGLVAIELVPSHLAFIARIEPSEPLEIVVPYLSLAVVDVVDEAGTPLTLETVAVGQVAMLDGSAPPDPVPLRAWPGYRTIEAVSPVAVPVLPGAILRVEIEPDDAVLLGGMRRNAVRNFDCGASLEHRWVEERPRRLRLTFAPTDPVEVEWWTGIQFERRDGRRERLPTLTFSSIGPKLRAEAPDDPGPAVQAIVPALDTVALVFPPHGSVPERRVPVPAHVTLMHVDLRSGQ